jgi:hypothetical protein
MVQVTYGALTQPEPMDVRLHEPEFDYTHLRKHAWIWLIGFSLGWIACVMLVYLCYDPDNTISVKKTHVMSLDSTISVRKLLSSTDIRGS